MKTGANSTDINQIKALLAEGYEVEEISERLQIVLSCVESFAKGEPTTKKKTKAAEKDINFADE